MKDERRIKIDDLFQQADDDDAEADRMESHLQDYIVDAEAEINDLRHGASIIRQQAREMEQRNG